MCVSPRNSRFLLTFRPSIFAKGDRSRYFKHKTDSLQLSVALSSLPHSFALFKRLRPLEKANTQTYFKIPRWSSKRQRSWHVSHTHHHKRLFSWERIINQNSWLAPLSPPPRATVVRPHNLGLFVKYCPENTVLLYILPLFPISFPRLPLKRHYQWTSLSLFLSPRPLLIDWKWMGTAATRVLPCHQSFRPQNVMWDWQVSIWSFRGARRRVTRVGCQGVMEDDILPDLIITRPKNCTWRRRRRPGLI